MARAATAVQPEKPVFDPEELAQAITDLAEGARNLLASRLSHRTIVLLLHDASGVAKRDIERILDALPDLDKRYTRKK